jgi:molybdopterin/thiamine biosynthesis adenylyltransferase
MNDQQLSRYARHLLLDHVDVAGQITLLASRVLVVGVGGLGSAASLYLASSGVGHLTLIDDDVVDLSNLQRQIAHTTARIGLPKVASAQTALQAINPDCNIQALHQRADADWLAAHVGEFDAVVDCSDNFATRHQLNAACVQHARPLISGSALQMAGQLAVFDTRQTTSPCYACIFPPDQPPGEASCATMGVFAPLVGIVGAMQASETLQVLLGTSQMYGQLLLVQAQGTQVERMRVARRVGCSVCSDT